MAEQTPYKGEILVRFQVGGPWGSEGKWYTYLAQTQVFAGSNPVSPTMSL